MLLSGCLSKPHSKELIMVVSQASYAYPGGDAADRDVHTKIIETDDYGRVLFAYNNGFGVYSVGIRQKNDRKFVYYYDNISFFYTDEYLLYTSEQVEKLKTENDWNQPMKEEKMIKRSYVDQYSLSKGITPVLDSEDLQRIFHVYIEEEEGIETDVFLFDENPSGQQLFYAWRRINTSTESKLSYEIFDEYLMVLNADGSYDFENYLLKIEDRQKISKPLAEIKEKNGWVG
jgi:hypothetical protein